MEDCIFCKIVKGEVPADKVYEDDATIAFADIHPKAPGHTLLVPKEHYEWFTDLPDELYIKLMTAARNVALKLKDEFKADYIRLSIVGRDVPHTHVHLIPQKMSDKGAMGV
jgi:histidine triad (HIT) family protein